MAFWQRDTAVSHSFGLTVNTAEVGAPDAAHKSGPDFRVDHPVEI